MDKGSPLGTAMVAAILLGSLPAAASLVSYRPIAESSAIKLDATTYRTSVTTLDVPRTNIRLGALRQIGRQPLLIVRVDANGRAHNFSTTAFPKSTRGGVPWFIGAVQGSGLDTWVTFQSGMLCPGRTSHLARGRDGSIWIRIAAGRWAPDDGPTIAHVERDGRTTFFAKPSFLGDMYTIGSTAAGDLWVFDAVNERLIRIDERGNAYLDMQFPTSEDHRLLLDARHEVNDAFWVSDQRERLVFIPLDGSPAKQYQLRHPVHGISLGPWITGGYRYLFGPEAGDAKGVWVSGGADVNQQQQWYGVDGTVLDIGENLDRRVPADRVRTDPSTGHWMFQRATIAQTGVDSTTEQIFEFDTRGSALVTSIEIPARNAGTPLSRNRPHGLMAMAKLSDGSYVFPWNNDTLARFDASHDLRLTRISF